MGKRKNKNEEYIKKKIRKLEKKLEKITPTEEDADSSPSNSPPRSSNSPMPPSLAPQKDTEDELPEELLQALGTEGEETTEVGEAIRPELALRWAKIMQTGLGKEPREAITKKYPPPINFARAVAPIMNPEIAASLSEPSLKRDKRICHRQNLTGKLMSCLGKSLTKVLNGNISTKVLVEEMNDAAKLAAEIYNQDSSSRNFFALAGTNKTVQDAVRTAKTDEFLFGVDCADKIKAAQTIQKAGSSIKSVEKKTIKPGPSAKKQVNWRGPPQYHQHQRVRGGQQRQQQQLHQSQLRPDQLHQKTRKPTSYRSRSKHHR